MATTKQSQSVRLGLRFKPELLREPYDAVVIGSGPGGLSAAVCLSKQGRKVAVFEQHYTAGGYTHAYTRRGWEWDVGIHYVGHLGPGEPMRVLSDYLTDGALHWASMGEVYDEYRLAGDVYCAPVGFGAHKQLLLRGIPRRARRHRRVLPPGTSLRPGPADPDARPPRRHRNPPSLARLRCCGHARLRHSPGR
jgi:phytoene dehydrogenase-like protein